MWARAERGPDRSQDDQDQRGSFRAEVVKIKAPFYQMCVFDAPQLDSDGRSIQIIYLSESTNTTQNKKYSTTNKSNVLLLIKCKYLFCRKMVPVTVLLL